MRPGSEFATWLAARWPALVRTLVFLGHPRSEAELLAREGVARALPAWERERRDGDVEVLVYRALLEAREHLPRHPDDRDSPHPLESGPDLPPGPTDPLERRRELESHLAGLTELHREQTVLAHVAELSEEQVADVLDTAEPVPALPFGVRDVRDACDAVPIPPVPVAEVLARSRSRRRRAWRRGVAVVGVAALILAATTWWTARPDESAEGEVAAATNPLPIPWYADDRLHLPRVVVDLPGVEDLVDVPDGVVFSDRDGDVVHVDSAGEQEQIGETVAGSRMAVDAEDGWVAWADPGEGDPELVVHDTLTGEEVGRRPLSGSGETGGQPVGDNGPIAIEDERVYYSSPDGDFAWEPLIDVSFALSGTMLDTAEQARVTSSEGVLRVTPLPFRTGSVINAEDARLTSDGRYAFALRANELVVYDVETGFRVERMYSPSDKAVAWAYDDGTFVFAVLHMLQDKQYQDMLQMPSEGAYRIYACRLDLADPCRKLTEVPEAVADAPIFAH